MQGVRLRHMHMETLGLVSGFQMPAGKVYHAELRKDLMNEEPNHS